MGRINTKLSEHYAQAALFQWAALQSRYYPDLKGLFAIPNGGLRHPATARRLKAEGVQAGVPDVFMAVPRGKYHGLFLELKAGRNRPTRLQEEWLEFLQSQGYRVEVCRGWEAAAETILVYLREGS